ncbi:dihydroneopterin aldolase [Halobacteroides halobius DSM 5150]|uniref:7,8-dihydroneopterin aldolase n=1 Tax=Halobacteroides halobius (strain ATCC 35273 / DSM 5150 / MD-1) TaxID=748449 RepID=L0K8M7_HALHC|nr:dihydroneopterin aldolase [Halobacteroides halobius]AGB40473.1 dihydroneopterin aldolase [Halobacteroides halobius DSM 5150]
MDKIILDGLSFYGYHGALEEENELGQKFIIDLELKCDLKEAGSTDQLKKSVNYAQVYQLVADICQNQQYKLLEALAENIAKNILQDFYLVEEILVKVKKPEAPIKGIFNYVAVEIERSRS